MLIILTKKEGGGERERESKRVRECFLPELEKQMFKGEGQEVALTNERIFD